MQQQVMHDDEISLREIIETVWDGRWIITSVTAVAVLLSGIVSFFILDPVYEVTTTVMVNSQVNGDQQKLVQNLSPFAEQVKSDFVVGKMIQKLEMNSKKASVNSIRNSINVEAIKDTNLIRITVKGTDPNAITNIANVVALELGAFIEISTRLDMIVGYKQRLIGVEDQMKIVQTELSTANKQLETTPEKLVTRKSLSDDPYMQSVVADNSNSSNKNLGSLQLLNEEVNPIYVELKSRVSDVSIQLSKLQMEKENLDERITSNQNTITALQKQINSNKQPSGEFVQSVNRFNAVLITPAVEPEFPVGPKKLMNLALAGVVGGMMSVFIVFIREYWRKSGITTGTDISI
jgi:succinoglycan biosynthesis transport protein ExoP